MMISNRICGFDERANARNSLSCLLRHCWCVCGSDWTRVPIRGNAALACRREHSNRICPVLYQCVWSLHRCFRQGGITGAKSALASLCCTDGRRFGDPWTVHLLEPVVLCRVETRGTCCAYGSAQREVKPQAIEDAHDRRSRVRWVKHPHVLAKGFRFPNTTHNFRSSTAH
jgi:hypothetical protein